MQIKKSKTFKIHSIVANTFLSNDNNLKEINHKNEIKTDNRIENLEWCTRSYNCSYGKGCINRKNSARKTRNMKEKKIYQYSKTGSIINIFNCIEDVVNKTGLNRTELVKCCHGKTFSYGGYVWKQG